MNLGALAAFVDKAATLRARYEADRRAYREAHPHKTRDDLVEEEVPESLAQSIDGLLR